MFLTDLIWLFGFYIFPVTVKRIILLFGKIARWFDGHACHMQKKKKKGKRGRKRQRERTKKKQDGLRTLEYQKCTLFLYTDEN